MVNRNPRAAPLTIEDQLIFNWLCENWFFLHRRRGLFSHCVESDQRDAERMFRMRECRDLVNEKGYDSCIIAGLETALEGYDDPNETLMDMGLACLLPKLPERYR